MGGYTAHFYLMKTILFLLSFAPFSLLAQFPTGWVGHYSGQMAISNSSGRTDTINVELLIEPIKPDTSWLYIMKYHSVNNWNMEKAYTIIRNGEGKFLIDEGDSLFLDITFMNNCLYSFYELDNTYFSSTIRLFEGNILFDLFGGKRTIMHSKDVKEDNATFTVDSYSPEFAQSVLLKRKQ